VCATRGVTLVRRDRNGGPAAARNTGLAEVASDIVVFLDSDCVPPPGWIDRLGAHLADPAVGVLSGAIALIEFPAIYLDEPAFATAQLRLLAGSSALRSRQAERFAPVALELEELVYLKLRAPNGNDATDGELRQRASLVISLGAGLLNRVALAAIDDPAAIKPGAAEELFDLLRPIWQSLL